MTDGVSETIAAIRPLDRGLEPLIRKHLDNLTKPPGSLGRLEDIAAQYCLIRGTSEPRLGRKRVYTFAADHGVAAENVSAYPQAVTGQMVKNMLSGGAAINVLARHAGAEVRIVDIGVRESFEDAPGLIKRKVRPGSANIATGPAMSVDEATEAILVGIDLAGEAVKEGVTLIGSGDMGIANTTPSSALFAALLPSPVEEVTGRGTGIDDAALGRKIRVIKRALEVNAQRLGKPLEALAAVGGFEIAGICGLILGGASLRVPVVVDGFISSAGALAAIRMCPPVKEYVFFSHCSAERGHRVFYERFGIRPLLDLNLRLGEGTGAALAISIIEASVRVYNEMATFGSAGVSGRSG